MLHGEVNVLFQYFKINQEVVVNRFCLHNQVVYALHHVFLVATSVCWLNHDTKVVFICPTVSQAQKAYVF